MPDVSLITSTYRAEAHLRAYSENVRQLAHDFAQAGKTLELVIVANDPTPNEEIYLQQLENATWDGLRVQVQRVPRESVYASWNRGVDLATSENVSFWGVDDTRYAAALLEGIQVLASWVDVVHFPYKVITTVNWGFISTKNYAVVAAQETDIDRFSRKMLLGPFFITTRAFYQRIGSIDPNFKVSGDFEWAQRAIRGGTVVPNQTLGGSFHVHGGNLSATTNPRKTVEENIIYLRFGYPQYLKPCDPALMKQAWEEWGSQGQSLPQETADWLWGEGAKERQEAWLKDWARRQRNENLRQVPRAIVNRLGLRPILTRIGILKRVT
jgi:glycosyltransferase involved in cell wall biosynthesis